MKAALGMAIALLASSSAHALTDYKCMQDCTQAGYMYAFCHSRCTVDEEPTPAVTPIQPYRPPGTFQYQPLQPVAPPTNIKQVDQQCMRNCTNAGYQFAYCQSRCSY